MRIGLTYGEYVEVGWAGKKHDQVMLRAVTDDPSSMTEIQLAASYQGNRHKSHPAVDRSPAEDTGRRPNHSH